MKWLDTIINWIGKINWLEIIKNYWWIGIILLIVLIILIRVKSRGYFWEDKYGNELSLREFFQRWGKGVEGITPVQQSLTSLWSFPLIFGGLITGIVINLINHVWWMVLILVGGFPPTLMVLVSTYQKYKSQKRAQDAYQEAMEQMRENE